MDKNNKMEVWNTPFAVQEFPSILSILMTDDLEVSVSSGGVNYHIVFPLVIAMKCVDESIPAGWSNCKPPSSSVTFPNSQWCRETEKATAYIEETISKNVIHYGILGGDKVLEVLCAGEPTVRAE